MISHLDSNGYIRYRLAQTSSSLSWRPNDYDDLDSWKELLRLVVKNLITTVQNDPIALDPQVVATQAFPGYVRELVRMESRPGLQMVGYFLKPVGASGPLPAVVCLPGHGRGVDSIVGIAADGSLRPLGSPDEYQQDFALQCVTQGYAVFALEQISFGHRRDEKARLEGPSASSCARDSTAALMLGETITGWRVWDAMRAIDYLCTREDVSADRIGTMGISGGGLTALFTAAVDLRVKCAVVSGYFNTFRDSVLSINHCVDNYIPNILKYCEMPDLAGLIAPRALFVESGETDLIFPVAAFKSAVTQAQEMYERFHCSQQFGFEIFPGGHQFHGKGAFQFMSERL